MTIGEIRSDGGYEMNEVKWDELHDYYFDRDVMVEKYLEVFTRYDERGLIELACQEGKCTDEFHYFYNSDTFYVIHLSTGIMITWYKHLGRCNQCNKSDFTTDDLELFFRLIREDLLEVINETN